MRIRHSTLATLLVIPLMVMSSPTKAGAPSVAVAQERTPFIVFFDWDKAVVLAEGTATVGEAAAAFGKFGGGAVRLIGHSDRSGGSAANARLALRRVDAVRALLIEKGVPESAIISQAVGESRPIVPVADGVREAQNRSVEIRLELAASQ